MGDFNVKLFLKILFGVILGFAALICCLLFLPGQILVFIVGIFLAAAVIVCVALSIYDSMT